MKKIWQFVLAGISDLKNGKLISPAWLNRAEQFCDLNKKE